MTEKIPEQPPQPEQRIDQEFYSAASRWFNGNKETLLKYADGKEEDENYALYQDQLKDQLTLLAQPKRLESSIQRDGTAEKYGDKEARAIVAAEGMALLGFHLSRLEPTKEMHADPEDNGDKKVYAELIKQSEEAKRLFMQAAEKVFTPSDITDPKAEIADIVQTYQKATQDKDIGLIGSLQLDFEHLNKSTGNPAELKKELDNTIDRLGSQLGSEVHYLSQGTDELSPEQEDKKRLVLAAGNKLLYRLAKAQEQLGAPEKETELKVPENWTILYHGSNLSRAEWQGDKRAKLDVEQLTLEGTGLSVISEEEKERTKLEKERLRQQGIGTSDSDTTKTYSMETRGGANEPLEMQIVFPEFHQRRAGYKEVQAAYAQKYGTERAKDILELSDKVHWKNQQGGRHPVLPSGMKLRKIGEVMRPDGARVVQYVPESLADIYVSELEKNK